MEENREPSDSAKHSKSDTSRTEQCARVLKWGRSINRKWFGEEYSSVRFGWLDEGWYGSRICWQSRTERLGSRRFGLRLVVGTWQLGMALEGRQNWKSNHQWMNAIWSMGNGANLAVDLSKLCSGFWRLQIWYWTSSKDNGWYEVV